MKLRFLGTSAGELYPGIWCRCQNCEAACNGKPEDRRQSAALYVEPGELSGSSLLIDFPSEIASQALRHHVPLGEVQHLLVTHSHGDHWHPYQLRWRGRPAEMVLQNELAPTRIGGPRFTELARLHIWGNAAVEAVLRRELGMELDYYEIEFHRIGAGEGFQAGSFRVDTVSANHDVGREDAVHFIIREAGKTILYELDGDTFLAQTRDLLKEYRFDLVILESTYGYGDGGNHRNFVRVISEAEWFRSEGVLTPSGEIVAMHFSPSPLSATCRVLRLLASVRSDRRVGRHGDASSTEQIAGPDRGLISWNRIPWCQPGHDTASFIINRRYLVDTGWGRSDAYAVLGRISARYQSISALTHCHHDHHYLGPAATPLLSGDARIREKAWRNVRSRSLGRQKIWKGVVSLSLQFLQPDLFPPVRCELELIPLSPGDRHETEEFALSVCRAPHPVPALCYRFEDRRTNQTVTFTGDTAYDPTIVEHARGTSLVIHEASYGEHAAPESNPWLHSGAPEAARVAREAGVKTLALVHCPESRQEAALAAAQAIFPDTIWPADGENSDCEVSDRRWGGGGGGGGDGRWGPWEFSTWGGGGWGGGVRKRPVRCMRYLPLLVFLLVAVTSS